jgi:hypothetical protein
VFFALTGSTLACNPATTRGASTKLSVDAKGEKIAYVNGRTVVVSSDFVELDITSHAERCCFMLD